MGAPQCNTNEMKRTDCIAILSHRPTSKYWHQCPALRCSPPHMAMRMGKYFGLVRWSEIAQNDASLRNLISKIIIIIILMIFNAKSGGLYYCPSPSESSTSWWCTYGRKTILRTNVLLVFSNAFKSKSEFFGKSLY